MTDPYYQDDLVTLYHGTAAAVARELEPRSVRTIVTSPPYFGLRDYGHDDQIGDEPTADEYVGNLVTTFASLRTPLADDGTLWLNLGDSYAGGGGSSAPSASSTLYGNGHRGGGPKLHKVPEARRQPQAIPSKNLLGIPWRVAFALQADGWILRSDIIWSKPNPMPESVTDRPTKAHEYLFLFAKSPRYYYDADAIKERAAESSAARLAQDVENQAGTTRANGGAKTNGPLRAVGSERVNKRTVWTVTTQPFKEAHFATYPPELIRPCILAGTERGDTVLDPFSGSGTTGMVATQEGRRYIGIDVNSDYLDLSLRTRFAAPVLDLTGGAA